MMQLEGITMHRNRTFVAAGILSLGATLLIAAPAGAFPWGHGHQGTNLHSPTCDCSDVPQSVAQAPQGQSPQKQAAVARQGSPSAALNGAAAGQQVR
jgi:hypothetical protein